MTLNGPKGYGQNESMTLEKAIDILRRHAPQLKAVGIVRASLFGSTTRGESDPGDVDIAERLNERFSAGGFDYFGQRDQLRQSLSKLLGCKRTSLKNPSADRASNRKSTGTALLPSDKPRTLLARHSSRTLKACSAFFNSDIPLCNPVPPIPTALQSQPLQKTPPRLTPIPAIN